MLDYFADCGVDKVAQGTQTEVDNADDSNVLKGSSASVGDCLANCDILQEEKLKYSRADH